MFGPGGLDARWAGHRVVTLVLAFFTPLTGASGITILAMGGLLLPMLRKAHYTERHAIGLVTVSGSIALRDAKWAIRLPVVTLTSIFGGFATLVEVAALTMLYAIVVECLIYRELRVTSDIPRVALESATMVGGFMIILGVALGLTNDLIMAQIPMMPWRGCRSVSTCRRSFYSRSMCC